MITKDLEKKLEGLGAFEISSKMLKLAKNNEKHNNFWMQEEEILTG